MTSAQAHVTSAHAYVTSVLPMHANFTAACVELCMHC